MHPIPMMLPNCLSVGENAWHCHLLQHEHQYSRGRKNSPSIHRSTTAILEPQSVELPFLRDDVMSPSPQTQKTFHCFSLRMNSSGKIFL